MIKVLHVDDDRLTHEITRINLSRFDPELELTWCNSGREALKRLAGDKFQAIISDFQMPGMDGLELLREVRARFSDIVFIFLTSQENENKVVEALRDGSDDYYTKDINIAHFQRIANSIRKHVRAVEDRAQRELSNHWLTHSNAIVRGILEASPYGICVTDAHGKVETANIRFGEILGVPADRLIDSLDELFAFLGERAVEPEDIRSRLQTAVNRPVTGDPQEITLRDGTVIELMFHPLTAADEFMGLLCTCADSTERVVASQENNTMRTFLDENNMGVMRLSQEGVILSSTRTAELLRRLWNPGGVDSILPLRLQKAVAQSVRENRTLDFVETVGNQSFLLKMVPYRAGGHLNLFLLNISGEAYLQEKIEDLRNLWNRTLDALESGLQEGAEITGSGA